MNILLLDIETAPSKGYIWSLWSEIRSMSFIDQDWYILCWCAKWLDEKRMFKASLHKSRKYKVGQENDEDILKSLWELLDKADVVIAHNGIKFDRRKINARFIKHGMKPPSPYRMIDTLLVARSQFAFTSNRLDDIGAFLKLGRKHTTNGFQLWKDCLEGKKQSWNEMLDYCEQDVKLLEKIYKELRPYIANHPNVGLYNEEDLTCCPKCGSSNINYRGYYYTNISKFHRFICLDCGGWGRDRSNCLDTKKKKILGTNAL